MTTPRILALLVAALLASACAGDSIVGPSELRGEWRAVHPGREGARTETRLRFGADGSFASEVLWYGNHGLPPATVTGYLRNSGRYRVVESRLELRIARSEQWQKHAVDPNPSVTSHAKGAWAHRGTVRVEGDRLFHTFVSAPADAPVVTTQVYQRVR